MAKEPFVVSRDVRIWGTIKSLEPVVVLGFVDGGITAPEIHVAQQAMVIGDIVASKAVITGEVSGNIFADELVLEPPCKIEGEIYHGTLDLREGAHFEGKSRRHDKPKSLASTLSMYDHSLAG